MAAFGLHAEDIIALQDFSLRVGGTEKATVTLSTDVENYRGFQADVILPIGVAITSVSDAGRGVETEDVNIQKTVGKAVAQEDGLTQKQTVVFALDCNLRAGEGELLKLTLAADASMAAGSERSQTFVLWRRTFAPYSSSASPIALPIPRVDPVTSATLPDRSNFSLIIFPFLQLKIRHAGHRPSTPKIVPYRALPYHTQTGKIKSHFRQCFSKAP